jgi:methyl-accepting chemotaxis protein
MLTDYFSDASLVEESAASSDSMKEQAQELLNLALQFNVEV